MASEYRTLLRDSSAEFIVNKSRFIGQGAPVSTEAQALEFLNRVRAAQKGASHNCFAYVVGQNAGIMRYSDDGEPGGTAGQPILGVMNAQRVVNCAVVVTRYFGGILLGAGGLTRAYTQGATEALRACGVVTMQHSYRHMVDVPYAMLDRALHKLEEHRNRFVLEEKEFAETATLTLRMRARDEEDFFAMLTELSDGRLEPLRLEEAFMAWEDDA